MKLKKEFKWARIFSILLIFCMVFTLWHVEPVYAAASYKNAKEFFESINRADKTECENGNFYFATKAKRASRARTLTRAGRTTFSTLGFDITLFTDEASVDIAVTIGGNYLELIDRKRDAQNYEYDLFCITTKSFYELAVKADRTAAEKVFSSGIINLKANAIMRKNYDGSPSGYITENDKGGVTDRNTVYHLKNAADFADMRGTFTNETFASYKDIDGNFENPTLSIYYVAGQGVNLVGGNTDYTIKQHVIGKTSYDNVFFKKGNAYLQQQKMFQSFYLLNPIAFVSKTGYSLPLEKEWKDAKGHTYSAVDTYMPKDFYPDMTTDKGLILYLNWQPNICTIEYDARGGSGVVHKTELKYDTTGYLRDNTFQKPGYILPVGEEWIDENGNTYSNRQAMFNITTETKTIKLYANWQRNILTITTNKQGGTGGTDAFYVKYGDGFYSDASCLKGIAKIDVPSLVGYNFIGYYNNMNAAGNPLVDSKGVFKIQSTYFSKDTTIHAGWEAKTQTVTFDKQGGKYGSDSVVATYDQVYPTAEAPDRTGYSFKGYYTGTNGSGTLIYDENMNSKSIFRSEEDITLYAYWVDETAPTVTLNVSTGTWTNKVVTLTAKADDYGTGLKSLVLYRILPDGSLEAVSSDLNLNAATSKTITFENTTEGVVRYKAVATDGKGNTAECYNVVYRDTKKPTGEIKEVTINGNTFYFKVEVSDTNVQ